MSGQWVVFSMSSQLGNAHLNPNGQSSRTAPPKGNLDHDTVLDNTFDAHSIEIMTKHIIDMLQIKSSANS
jgi:hypothetical protein